MRPTTPTIRMHRASRPKSSPPEEAAREATAEATEATEAIEAIEAMDEAMDEAKPELAGSAQDTIASCRGGTTAETAKETLRTRTSEAHDGAAAKATARIVAAGTIATTATGASAAGAEIVATAAPVALAVTLTGVKGIDAAKAAIEIVTEAIAAMAGMNAAVAMTAVAGMIVAAATVPMIPVTTTVAEAAAMMNDTRLHPGVRAVETAAMAEAEAASPSGLSAS